MTTPANSDGASDDSKCPMSGEAWKTRDHADEIPCPALLTLYNNGLLNPKEGEDGGELTTDELDEVLVKIGVSSIVRKVLVRGADKSDGVRDGKFNLFQLRDSNLDHSGSTGIRDPKVDPSKLDSMLLDFGENGRLYAEHFAAAAANAREKDPGIKGTVIETVEFTALLEVFGRVDESDKRYLTNEDVRRLWIEGKFPEGWKPRTADVVGAGDVALGVADMVLKRVLTAVGF